MITGVAGRSRLTSSSSLKPSIPAIRTSDMMSDTIRSAPLRLSSSSARSALSASITEKPSGSSVATIMRRMLRSSSTTRILANHFLPNRKLDDETAALAAPAAGENPAVVSLDDFLGDVQSEPGRAGARRLVGKLRVRLEDPRQHVFGDSGAGVGHDHARGGGLGLDFD